MGLIDHEQANPVGNVSQNVLPKSVVGQSLRRNQQEIDTILLQILFHPIPIVGIAAVDRPGRDADPFGGFKLVAHQGEQRRNEQCRSGSLVTKQPGSEKVDDAFPPSGPLYNQNPFAFQQPLNTLPLAVPKDRLRMIQGPP